MRLLVMYRFHFRAGIGALKQKGGLKCIKSSLIFFLTWFTTKTAHDSLWPFQETLHDHCTEKQNSDKIG